MHAVHHRKPLGSRVIQSVVGAVVRSRPAFWLVRLYFGCSVLVTCAIAYTSSTSVQRVIFDRNGPAGWFILAVVAFCAVVAILDVIANDMFPEQLCNGWCVGRRHQVYLIAAMGLTCILYINAVQSASIALMLRYGTDAIFAVVIAVLDLGSRMADVRRDGRRWNDNRPGGS